MRNWFRRSQPGDSLISKPQATTVDHATWLEAFRSHWNQASLVMHGHKNYEGDHIAEIFNHLDQMALLLLTEINSKSSETDAAIGPIMDFVFVELLFEQIVNWSISVGGGFSVPAKVHQLKMYETLIIQSFEPILFHKPLLHPLLTLLDSCSRAPHSEVERNLVVLLNQICVQISQDVTLLEFFFPLNDHDSVFDAVSSSSNSKVSTDSDKFKVFSLLVPYLYREGNVGQLARDALLLILAVSPKSEPLAKFVADSSNFCPVLATGLSGLYSMLPRKLVIPSDDWHRITREDIDQIAPLNAFHSALEFCNAVVQVAHVCIQEQLLEYIYQGFLVPVMNSALHESFLDEVISSTAYLQLFFETVTEPALMRIFIRFLLTEKHQNTPVLDSLITRISSNSRLCLVSLSLFNTLLNLNCEDLMYELVLKYLIPCTHVMISQTRSLRDIDLYGRAAYKFLSLVPACCSAVAAEVSDPGFSTFDNNSLNENWFGSIHHGSVNSTDNDNENNSLDKQLQIRRAFQRDYLTYLLDSQVRVEQCYAGCGCWSLPYDGETPDPSLFWEETSTPGTTSSNGTDSPVDSPKLDGKMSRQPSGRSFKRTSSTRQSARTSNSYFASKRVSSLLNPSSYAGISAIDLSLGQDDLFEHIDALEQAAAAGQENRYRFASVSSTGDQTTAADGGDVEVPSRDSSSHVSSEQHTPSIKKRAKALPDYFTLTFDEDMMRDLKNEGGESENSSDPQTNDGLEDIVLQRRESGISSSDGQSNYILTGWSQIHDLETFQEVLGRVRLSKSSSQSLNGSSIEDTMDFIDQRHAAMCRSYDSSQHDSAVDVDAPVESITDMIAPSVERLNLPLDETDEFNLDDIGMDLDERHSRRTNSQSLDGRHPFRQIPCPAPSIFKSSFKSPNIGPFLSVILHKLENMTQNSLFVNLQLTGVISRLSCYPQPLLYSFLLNHSLVFQPSVRSLTQILGSVKHKIDAYATSVDDFGNLILKGKRYLLNRDREFYGTDLDGVVSALQPAVESGGPMNNGSGVPQTLQDSPRTRPRQNSNTKPRSISDLFSKSTFNDVTKGRRFTVISPALSRLDPSQKDQVDESERQLSAMKSKNMAYCAIVIEAFLKELAATSQSHAIVYSSRFYSVHNNN